MRPPPGLTGGDIRRIRSMLYDQAAEDFAEADALLRFERIAPARQPAR